MFQAMSLTLLGMAAWLAPGNEAFLAGTAVSGIIVDHLLTIVVQIKKGSMSLKSGQNSMGTSQLNFIGSVYSFTAKWSNYIVSVGCVLTLFVCYIL